MSAHGPWILGVSASHNGAVCLLNGDEIVVAIQEERLSRIKRHRIYGGRPSLATEYCLSYAGIEASDLDLAVFCIQGRASHAHQDVRQNPLLATNSHRVPTLVIPHHYGHALSAFATSGFSDAAILVVDGAGSPISDLTEAERQIVNGDYDNGYETTSLYSASGTQISPLEKHCVDRGHWLTMSDFEMPSFGSLGGMYSAVAQQIFGEPMDAGKVMGLAPYGAPEIRGSDFFSIEANRFNFRDDVPLRFRHNERWPARSGEYQMLASSVQAALEDGLMYLVKRLRGLCASSNLCYAGGVALNSVANERIIRESGFDKVYIMPAAEDSGPAIGAAYYGLWRLVGQNSSQRLLHDSCGRRYSPAEVSAALAPVQGIKIAYPADVISAAVDLLREGKIIGWFDGRSELGPRALGQRSILCDPRRPEAKALLNARVKKREEFRPFAPAILLEEAEHWFEFNGSDPQSPFMLRVCKINPERIAVVPAIVHVDGTGRLQTVTRTANGRFYELINAFYAATGVPMILNTSFNVMGQPIIETPSDAINCMLGTGIDCCVFEDRIVFKNT
jgi:carbamoyltransferase